MGSTFSVVGGLADEPAAFGHGTPSGPSDGAVVEPVGGCVVSSGGAVELGTSGFGGRVVVVETSATSTHVVGGSSGVTFTETTVGSPPEAPVGAAAVTRSAGVPQEVIAAAQHDANTTYLPILRIETPPYVLIAAHRWVRDVQMCGPP